MNHPDKDALMEMLETAVARLSEHFNTVQIFAARYTDATDTEAFRCGTGDIYSRKDQVREWLLRLDEQARQHSRNNPQEME